MEKILSILACPVCKNKVVFHDQRDEISCTACHRSYRVKNNIPFMLDDESAKELQKYISSSDGRSMVDEYDKKGSYLKLYKAARRLTGGGSDFHIPVTDKFNRIIDSAGADGKVLEIGSGTRRFHEKIINFDINAFENVDIVGNGARLPFLNESIDAIFILAVLEHTRQPQMVIQECFRVLKKGGIIYSEVPFVFRYHSYPTDFWRYSLQGQEELFHDFRKEEDGVCVGPSSGLLTFLTHYISLFTFSNNNVINGLIKGLTYCFLFPIKYLDILLLKNKRSHELAAGIYFMGRKR